MSHFKHLLFLFIFFVSIHAIAQNATSSSVMGRVTDSKGEAIIGATVVALHNPSGSVSGNTTRNDGSYNLPSVRIGGPYTLTVSYIGYKTQKLDNVFLSLGQAFEANFVLIENTVNLAEAEVVVEKNSILNDKRTGASTTITKEQLQTLPTINRSLYDFLRLTPQGRSSSVASTAGAGISFAGQDSRYNNLTIDGSVFNNSFGLASAPGGQTNSTPISLDAIQEIQVNLAPFDIRYNGFTGAGINTVTRSGTNTFEGSIFRNLRNESMVGRYAGDNTVTTNKFSVNQTGFRLGGPIIKNKVFFFVNGEFERRSDPATQFLAARSGVSGANATRVTASSLDSLHNFLMTKYGYDAGEYENYALLTQSNKFLAKIDWNVNSKNRVSVRYNSLYSKRDVPMSNSGVISGSRSNNTDALGFSNANYIINNNLTSVIAELNTNIGNSMTNSVQVGYTAMRDFRSSNNETPFPFVDILSGGKTYTSFGYELFTPNNRLNTDVIQFQDNFTKYLNKHTITAGINFQQYKFENTFTPRYYGNFAFNSLSDFYKSANGDTTGGLVSIRQYQLTYSALSDKGLPTATTKVNYPGIYIQDEYNVNKRFKLTAGVRVDIPIYGNTALNNSKVDTLKFMDETGKAISLHTDKLPKSNPLFSPRIGFNWNVKGNRKLQVRGGTGLFSGTPPFVYISNQVGNNGVLTGAININNTTAYQFSADPNRYIPATPTLPSTYNIAVVDQNYKFPQLWRTNLAADAKLPGGIIGTFEAIYSKNVNAVYYINANMKSSVGTYSGVDNRPYYGNLVAVAANKNDTNKINKSINDATVLKSNNMGSSMSITAKFEKTFKEGLYLMAAYNFAMAKDLTSASSIAFSSWANNLTVNGNNYPTLAYSDFDQRQRIIAAISYTHKHTEGFSQTIGMFFQSGSQGRYSFGINGDINGDQTSNNDLMFIPSKASDIKFQALTVGTKTYSIADQQTAFDNLINSNDYLKANRGNYAARNGALLKMFTTVDFSYAQNYSVKVKNTKHTLQLHADIYNLGNLLNKNWGVGQQVVNNVPLKFVKRDAATNEPVYQMQIDNQTGVLPVTVTKPRFTLEDVWQMQFGIRYSFN